MNNYVKIKEDLYVVEQEIKNTKSVEEKRESCNHIIIFDRSGSMFYVLHSLCEQLCQLVKKIPQGDTVSIAWFSGEGQHRFIIKGFKISNETDYEDLHKIIMDNSSTVYLTCFSGVLNECETVVEDLSVFSKSFSLHFLSDGFPVVENYKKEINGIYVAIDKIKGKINSSCFVGYGHHYNKPLLTEMAERLGSVLIHSSEIAEYSSTVLKLINSSDMMSSKQEISIDGINNIISIFSISENGIMLYSVDGNGKLYISPEKNKSTFVYYICESKPKGEEINIDDIDFTSDSQFSKGMYGSVYVLTQKAQTDLAIDIAGKIRDKNIIDSLNSAFVITDYAECEQIIGDGVYRKEDRFLDGVCSKNYVAPDDVFSIFDILNKLMDDDESMFYPYADKWIYNKISRSAKQLDSYPKFIPNKDEGCSLTDLVWHESRLNLSVKAKINGHVKLNNFEKKTPGSVGLKKSYNCHIFRNYSIIKDGIPNVKNLYVKTSEETYKYFLDKGICIDDNFYSTGIYSLNLKSLPVINRSISKGKTSSKDLCEKLFRQEEIKAALKVYKYYLKELDDVESFSLDLTVDQQNLLDFNGIKKGGLFSPKVETAEATDMYVAKSFQVKIKSLSSLPSVNALVNALVKKISSGKKMTLSESVMYPSYVKYESVSEQYSEKKNLKKAWLESEIEDLKKELYPLRKEIQKVKFAVILGNQWFFPERKEEGNVEVLDDKTFTFILKEETVNI